MPEPLTSALCSHLFRPLCKTSPPLGFTRDSRPLTLALPVFDFFKKKAPASRSSAQEEAPPASAPAELTPEQKKLITAELELLAQKKGSNLDVSIGLLHMTGDKIYLKGILQFLEKAEVGLLVKQPSEQTDFLIMMQNGLTYLPIFTKAEHTTLMAKRFPTYNKVAFVDAKKLFASLQPGMGLWINPGHSVFTYLMPPSMFTGYVAILLKKK